MLTPSELLKFLEQHQISYTLYHHQAVASEHDLASFPPMQGEIVKNLVLINKKKELFLFTLTLHARANLKGLAEEIGSGRFSFAKKSDLVVLGVPAGMVSPLCLINDVGFKVRFILPKSLSFNTLINCHPALNTQSLDLNLGDLVALLESLGHKAFLSEKGLL